MPRAAPGQGKPMSVKQRKVDRIIASVSIVFAIAYFYQTGQITMLDFGDPIGPRLFPYFAGALFLIGALLLLVETRSSAAREPEAEVVEELAKAHPDSGEMPRRAIWMMAAVIGWTLLYIAIFEHVGYLISTVLLLIGLTFYFHPRRWLTNIAVSVLVPATAYFVFHNLLHISLPTGLLSF